MRTILKATQKGNRRGCAEEFEGVYTRRCSNPTTNPRMLSHDDYTVGWICALPLEMTATRAMLEEIHPDLGGLDPNDHNVYTLGKIYGHNVVITCLPSGVYGTTSATRVADQMLFSFHSITIPLMVGIGGGAPNEAHDIRLGDIVIGVPTSESAAVVQYDLGKTISPGVLVVKGTLNKPASLLLAAVSKLQANHGLKSSIIPKILSSTFEKHPEMRREFSYPGKDYDVLHRSDCDALEQGQICKACSSPDLRRQARSDNTPRLHYGTIASGNQVMKHGRTRDQLAQRYGFLCFEMEAAGLMDNFTCLVIRGICDYSDAHKQKHFQRYAALVAAAYAVELLSTIPPRVTTSTPTPNRVDPKSREYRERRERVMKSLCVSETEVRRATTKDAHLETCKWLLQQSEFRDWLDESKFPETQGLLWIKGKPGTGKSTLMKYTLTHIERTFSSNAAVISFFFNARGVELEKSTAGTYRSLLFQLLEKFPDLQDLLDKFSLLKPFKQWHEELLKEAFCKAVKRLQQQHLFCFVDALDECPEDQGRNLIEFFESLGEIAMSTAIHFHICFSSRHYPHITVKRGLQLILESQLGHSDDISSYLTSKLKIGESKQAKRIPNQIIQKASGIFLWVVLVVQILNKEYDKGRVHTLQEMLQKLPAKLDELFKNLLMRGNGKIEELVLCIQWVLHAKRPLSPAELYCAMLSDPELGSPVVQLGGVTLKDMERFILNSSKGLTEMTVSEKPTVQFIHESVREFLVRTDALIDLWPEFRGISEGIGHERLKNCCCNCMKIHQVGFQTVESSLISTENFGAIGDKNFKISKSFPFFKYAVNYVLHHANLAEGGGVAQSAFIEEFPLSTWIDMYTRLRHGNGRRYTHEASLLYIFADQDLPNLVKIQLGKNSSIFIRGECYGSPLLAAFARGNNNAVQALLMPSKDMQSYSSNLKKLSEELDQDIAAHFGTYSDRIVEWQNDLCYVVGRGSELISKLLLDLGAEVNAKNDVGRTPLWYAINKRHEALVRLLLDRGADTDLKNNRGETPLCFAVRHEDEAIVRLLLNKGAEVDLKCGYGKTPLCYAARKGCEAVVRLLLDEGAKVDSRDDEGETPLFYAVLAESEDVVNLLLERGADVNLKNTKGLTALSLADYKGYKSIASLLSERAQGAVDLSSTNLQKARSFNIGFKD